MPVIKSAIKKLRKDRKREAANDSLRKAVQLQIKRAFKGKQADVNKAFSIIDKAAKKNIIHKNKAARLKSQLAKSMTSTKIPKSPKTVNKSGSSQVTPQV